MVRGLVCDGTGSRVDDLKASYSSPVILNSGTLVSMWILDKYDLLIQQSHSGPWFKIFVWLV